MWSIWKTYKCLTFKSGSSQIGRFQKGLEGWEISSQNRNPLFKVGLLEHMLSPLAMKLSAIVKHSSGGMCALNNFFFHNDRLYKLQQKVKLIQWHASKPPKSLVYFFIFSTKLW